MLIRVPDLDRVRDPITDIIAQVNGMNPEARMLMTGVYICGHWSLDVCAQQLGYKLNSYPSLPYINEEGNFGKFSANGEDYSEMPPYGVCDAPDEFFIKFQATLKDPNRQFFVAMVEIKKSEEEEQGWRWHKWGPYVGNQKPTTEYLLHEPVIERVYTYHVYEILNKQ